VYGDLTAPVVIIHEGVIFEGNCAIKPKEDVAFQTDQKLSASADRTAEPTKSSAKPQATAGSAKMTN
jgi:cytoskeletal protein CcmA (bactofilin family)